MKTTVPTNTNKIVADQRPIQRRSIIWIVVILGLAFLVSTSGFQTYWSKERRLIAAADEIVTALRALG